MVGLIFRDRDISLRLGTIPSTLPHREEQITQLHSFFRDALTKPSQNHLRTVQIVGSVGCDKNAATRLFGDRSQEEAGRVVETIQKLDSQLRELKERVQPFLHRLPSAKETLTVAAVDSLRSPRLSERLGVRYGVFASGIIYLKGVKKRREVFRTGVFKRKQALS